MIYRNHFLTIDMRRANVIEKLYVRQAEIGNKLHVTLTEGMTPLALPESTEGLVMLAYTKPDGTKSDVAMTVEDNVASAVIPRAAVDAVGEVKCELRVYDSVAGTWWTTPTFVIEVQAVQYDEAAQQEIVSDPTLYEEICTAYVGWKDYIDDLKAAVLAGDFNGQDGADGQDGQDGQDGAQGPQGPQGPKGDKGDPGAPVDDSLDSDSENPVENKVIVQALTDVRRVIFARCSTAANTSTKELTVLNQIKSLTDGTLVVVYFYETNTVNPSTTVKLKIVGVSYDVLRDVVLASNGNISSGSSDVYKWWNANEIVTFVYYKNKMILNKSLGTSNVPGLLKISDATNSTSQDTAASSKAVKTVKESIPTISTDITADALSDVKTASPKAIKTYVDAQTGGTSATGTFVPNFTPDAFMADTIMTVKQIGSVVYFTGWLRIDGTWTDLGGYNLGDITGVAVPGDDSCSMPITTMDNNGNYHTGMLFASEKNGSTRLSVYLESTADSIMVINGFYFT